MSPPTKIEFAPPREVMRIARMLAGAGHGAWAVGGAIRDTLAGLAPGDWDLTTSARPADMRRIFKRTVPVGIAHGTVGVLGKDGRMYEVTTFRRDVETDGRRARVRFADTIDEDLDRRDFTINAVAWNPLSGELRDPHGGADDLRAGILRTVGDARERFTEDRLRVLRALRFAGRFDLRIDDATWSAVRDAANQLGGLSAERIREELYKVLRVPSPSRSLTLYEQSDVLRELYPELQASVGRPATERSASGDVASGAAVPRDVDSWAHAMRLLEVIPAHKRHVRLAALMHAAGSGAGDTSASAAAARRIMRRLKASNADTDRVMHLVAHHGQLPDPAATAPELRRWIRRVGREFVRDVLRLSAADRIASGVEPIGPELAALCRRLRATLAERAPMGPDELAIDGSDLRDMGLPPGPLYGEILRDLLERVTDDPALNDPETLREIVRGVSQLNKETGT
jgi:tRNA nucleotidyltransferase/poly(A) polymerase